jgi:hypothetical protein
MHNLTPQEHSCLLYLFDAILIESTNINTLVEIAKQITKPSNDYLKILTKIQNSTDLQFTILKIRKSLL